MIKESYSLGDVKGISEVGGFVGKNQAFIRDCYSRGDVFGEDRFGGFVGFVIRESNLKSNYSTGKVYSRSISNGRESVHLEQNYGFSGNVVPGANFWCKTSSEQINNRRYAIGLSSEDFVRFHAGSFAVFMGYFRNIWKRSNANINDGYPTLLNIGYIDYKAKMINGFEDDQTDFPDIDSVIDIDVSSELQGVNLAYNLFYVPTVPAIVYAKSSCVGTHDLEYVLVNDSQQPTIELRTEPLFVWTDVLTNEKIEDNKKTKDNEYSHHSLNIRSMIRENNLLKSNMYFPKNRIVGNYKLSLDNKILNNNPDSSLYKINPKLRENQVVSDTEMILSSNIDESTINKLNYLEGLFKLIEDRKVCVINTKQKTDLFWTSEVLDPYILQQEQLIKNISDLQTISDCPEPTKQDQQTQEH